LIWDECYYSNEGKTCAPSDACRKHETSYADSAFELMKENGWYLNCPEYKRAAKHHEEQTEAHQ
jgi:hypothetical protein